MTTDELITRARHALETGQPNLARLYMRKALEQTDQQRRELNPLAHAIRRARRAIVELAEAFTPLVHQYAEALEKLSEALNGPEPRKSDFTLAEGPAK